MPLGLGTGRGMRIGESMQVENLTSPSLAEFPVPKLTGWLLTSRFQLPRLDGPASGPRPTIELQVYTQLLAFVKDKIEATL